MKKSVLNLLIYIGISLSFALLVSAQQPDPQDRRRDNRDQRDKYERDSVFLNNNKLGDSLRMTPVDTPPSLVPDSIPLEQYTPGNR